MTDVVVTEEHDLPLLPHQYEVVADTTSPVIVLEGGLGSGKTFAALVKMLALIDASPGVPGLWIEPTYDLIGSIVLPTVDEFLEKWGVPYRFCTSWQGRSSVLLVHEGTPRETPVYLRSGDRPERIVGFKIGWFILDEADSQDVDVWRRASGRLRDTRSTCMQRVAVYTPEEGFGWTWKAFHESPEPGTRLIDGVKTSTNVFNQSSYVEMLRNSHDEEDAERVLSGKRAPKNGLVYKRFGEINCSPCRNPLDGQLVVGADFNVGKMSWIIGTRRGHDIHFFDEIVRENVDTISQCEELQDRVRKLYEAGNERLPLREMWQSVQVVPDASANQRRTSSAGTASDLDHLIRAGFDVRRPSRNPPVRDRVFAVNLGFAEKRIHVDKARCPELYRCLSQQSWDTGKGEPDKSRGLDHAVDAMGYVVHFFEPAHSPRGNERTYPQEKSRWT